MARRIVISLIAMLVLVIMCGVAVTMMLRPPPPLRASQSPNLVLSGITLVNPGQPPRPGVTIAIQGPRIKAITTKSLEDRVQGQFELRQYRGTYVLPGLIDLHVHHPPAVAELDTKLFELLYLAHGVTAVRDTGNFDGSILHTRDQILRGDFAGPRIFACGPLIDGDPPVWPGSVVVHNYAEAVRAVDKIAAEGMNCVKAYTNLAPDALGGLRDAARSHRLPLIGHVPWRVPLQDAHIPEVQHLTGVAQTMPPTPFADFRATTWSQLGETRIKTVVALSKAQELSYTPTMIVMQRTFELASGAFWRLHDSPEAHLLPRYYRDLFWPTLLAQRPQDTPDTAQIAWNNFELAVRQLHTAGVPLHVGTDTINPFVVPGASMWTELRDLVHAGFTPEQAWAAATSGNGAALPEPNLGVIGAGAPADLLVFRHNPANDLDALSTLEAVVANGRFYSRTMLDDAETRYQRYFNGWMYDRMMMYLVRRSLRASFRSPIFARE
jgi:hypothetical protein